MKRVLITVAVCMICDAAATFFVPQRWPRFAVSTLLLGGFLVYLDLPRLKEGS